MRAVINEDGEDDELPCVIGEIAAVSFNTAC